MAFTTITHQCRRHARGHLAVFGRTTRFLLLLVAFAPLISSAAIPAPSMSVTVTAAVETQPVPHGGDAADDAAIWLDPTNPDRSTIIGTDKLGGLAVYDLTGKQLAYYEDSTPNNVDLRTDFPLGGDDVSLVVTSDTTSDSLRAYRVDPSTRGLVDVTARTLDTGLSVSGLCLYVSPISGDYYAFVSDSSGTVQQWELRDNGEGRVDPRKVRTISVGSTSEGCVADDRNADVYIAEEDVGIWRYGAEPDAGEERVSVDHVGSHLTADVEGLAIYDGNDRYLIASSQGSDDFAVYSLAGDYLGRFAVGDGDIDGVSHTDGIEVINADLSGAFASGLFLAQDDRNGDGNQNFKLVPWATIAQSFTPSLTVDTTLGDRHSTALASPVATPRSGAANSYFVDSRSGNDENSGTSDAAPWETLARAGAAHLQPGDRLLFRRGSSWTGTLPLHTSGSRDEPILVGSYGSGDLPIFSGGCLDVTGSYIAIHDIKTAECSFAGIALSGSDNRVERCQLTTSVAGVYVKAGSRGNQILNNQIVDNNQMSVLDRSNENDSGAFGVLINGDETEVAFNTISGSDAFSYDYGRDGAAIEIFGGQRNTVHHNVAVDNDAFVELGDSNAEDNTLAYNLVASSLQTSTGIVTRGDQTSRGPVSRTRVDNNTIVLSGTESQGFVCFGGCSAQILTMRNNIIQSPGKVGYADAPFDEDYNLFYGGQIQFTPGAHSIITNPDLAANSFEPAPESPAIDRGVVLGYGRDLIGHPVPIDGNGDGEAAPDLGAYEYVPSVQSHAGSTMDSSTRIDGHVNVLSDELTLSETVVPLLKRGGGVAADGIQRHRHEGEARVLPNSLPGPRAAIEIERWRRSVAEWPVLRLVGVSEDIEGRGSSGVSQHPSNLLCSPHQVVCRHPNLKRSVGAASTPPTGAQHSCRQAVECRFCQQIDLSQYLSRDSRFLRLFRHHGGPISVSVSAVRGQSTSSEAASKPEGQSGNIRRDTGRTARSGTRDVTKQPGKGIGCIYLGSQLFRDALSKDIEGRT